VKKISAKEKSPSLPLRTTDLPLTTTAFTPRPLMLHLHILRDGQYIGS